MVMSVLGTCSGDTLEHARTLIIDKPIYQRARNEPLDPADSTPNSSFCKNTYYSIAFRPSTLPKPRDRFSISRIHVKGRNEVPRQFRLY